MRIRTLLWLIAIVGCAALGIWQRQNLSIFLREYNALWRDTDYNDGSMSYRRPLIPENVSQTDPEAAKIAEHIFGHYERDEWLLSIAEGILKYPQNEFLLNEFAGLIWHESEYDCQIKLKTAKRLISANPQKPFYHYFLADALFSCGSDINSVLDAVEQGNRCSDYNIPYDKYKQRVIDIAKKAMLGREQIRDLGWERYEESPYQLDKKLIGFAATAFADGNNLIGTRICDIVYEMQRKHFLAGDQRAICQNNLSMMGSFVYFGNWYNPEGLELQRVELSKKRARENRLRLCSRVPEFVLATSEESYVRPQSEIKDEQKVNSAYIATILAPYFGRMFISVGLAILILALFCLADGYVKNEKVGLAKTLMFAFACLVFFLAARGMFIRSAHGDICGCRSYTTMLHPPKIALNALQNEPVLTVLFVVVPLAGLILLQISRKNRWLSKWRVVWLAVAAALFGLFSIATWGYVYLEYFVMLLFILFSAATIVGPSPRDKSPIASLLTLFGTDTQYVSVRVKCLKLVAPFIIVYWIVFIGQIPASAYRINYEAGRESPPRKKYTVLEPNEATYQRVLNYLENAPKTRYRVSMLLGLVMPEDLPNVLKKLKELPSNEYDGEMMFRPSRRGGPIGPRDPNRTADSNRDSDALLTRVITSSGRDVVGILTAAMADPNHPRALLARAKLGDVTAKKPLEELLKARLEADPNLEDINEYGDIIFRPPYHPKQRNDEDVEFSQADPNLQDSNNRRGRGMMFSPYLRSPNASEMTAALAPVSEPNEAAQRYLSFIQRHSMPEVIDDDFDFIKGINLLPTQQARVVLKAYLANAADWQTPPEKEFWPSLRDALNSLRDVVGSYADREIAEGVFRLMLRVYENDGELRELNISPYFTIESAELIKKGLTVPNYRFRAWSVWQLRRVGYKFSQEEFDKLLKDDSWMVRANAVMAEPQMAKDIAVNDKNSFVRFAATLSADSQ